MRLNQTKTLLPLALLGLIGATGIASAQYPPARPQPAVTLGAPVPAELASVHFLGARYSFPASNSPVQGFGYYRPGYTAPMFFNPRYRDTGPYFYTRSYPYSDSYYSYYYTPGFFRY